MVKVIRVFSKLMVIVSAISLLCMVGPPLYAVVSGETAEALDGVFAAGIYLFVFTVPLMFLINIILGILYLCRKATAAPRTGVTAPVFPTAWYLISMICFMLYTTVFVILYQTL